MVFSLCETIFGIRSRKDRELMKTKRFKDLFAAERGVHRTLPKKAVEQIVLDHIKKGD